MEWEQIRWLVESLGVPGAVLAFVGISCWFGGRWLASECIRPLVVAHVEFLRTVTQELKALTVASQQQIEALRRISDKLDETRGAR